MQFGQQYHAPIGRSVTDLRVARRRIGAELLLRGPVSQQANGWTVGTGLEYRLTSWPNFSVGLEYDYTHLNAGNVATCVTATGVRSGFCGGGVGGTQPMLYNNFHANVNEIMARANYTFNWAAK